MDDLKFFCEDYEGENGKMSACERETGANGKTDVVVSQSIPPAIG